jgi:hypothetical protein
MFKGNFLTPYDLARNRRQDACANYLLYQHGGQRGNLLAQIFVRRIQKCYRQYKHGQFILVHHRRKLFANQCQTNPPRHSSTTDESLVGIVPIKLSIEQVLDQAAICLYNKRLDDRLTQYQSTYLVDDRVKRRRRTHARPTTARLSMRTNNLTEYAQHVFIGVMVT